MSIRFLKVKVKSLAVEAAIIRLEETRSRGELRSSLRFHRQHDVRREQRCAQLAYGYLRGVPMARIEPGAKTTPDWDRVRTLIKKFGPRDAFERFDAWNGYAILKKKGEVASSPLETSSVV
jgi:hypothetical protein